MDFALLREQPPDLFITAELARRHRPAAADPLREKRAIEDLATRMASSPEDVLPRFVDLAMELTGGTSAGLSLLESHPAPGQFRWRYLRGSLAPFEHGVTPRNFSPCGVTLDNDSPTLCLHPERFYDWLSEAKIALPEVLLVPLAVSGADALGTLWVVSENEGHFNREHSRIAVELASFVGVALKMQRTEKRLQTALKEQEMLTREMSHRIKNLFPIAESMVRMAVKISNSKEELGELLIGRFHALASAQGLIRRSFGPDGAPPTVSNIVELVQTVVEPHERHLRGKRPRFAIAGPSLTCGEHALNGIALIFNELATNAVKYGALAADKGQIEIRWATSGDAVVFDWLEQGGPQLSGTPSASGFGSKLLRDTVAHQFHGTLDHDWQPGGLRVQLLIPLKALTN